MEGHTSICPASLGGMILLIFGEFSSGEPFSDRQKIIPVICTGYIRLGFGTRSDQGREVTSRDLVNTFLYN